MKKQNFPAIDLEKYDEFFKEDLDDTTNLDQLFLIVKSIKKIKSLVFLKFQNHKKLGK
jgi:hypothetical protein